MKIRALVVAVGMAAASIVVVAAPTQATTTTYFGDVDAFNDAAGSPPVSVSFDDVAADTDISGTLIAQATWEAPSAPLIVVRAKDTFSTSGTGDSSQKLSATSGENVLSPGGKELPPDPDPNEVDDLTITFKYPVSAVGFDLLFQSQDCCALTDVSVQRPDGTQLWADEVPGGGDDEGGGPGGSYFLGWVSDKEEIGKVVLTEYDGTAPDANIGFDTFRYVPPPDPPECQADPSAVCGSEGNDKIKGTSQDDTIYAGEGNDTIDGGGGNDTIVGGAGNDVITGGDGDDVLGGDAPSSSPSRELAFLYSGLQETPPGADVLDGGDGNDTINGNGGGDRLNGGAGTDEVMGSQGTDKIAGGAANDALAGGGGPDVLNGGPGTDDFNGGPGSDTCILSSRKEDAQSCEKKKRNFTRNQSPTKYLLAH